MGLLASACTGLAIWGDAANWTSLSFLGYAGAVGYVAITWLEARNKAAREQRAEERLLRAEREYAVRLDEVARQIVVQQLRVVYEGLFDKTPDRRLTIFVPNEIGDELVPWVRYAPGSLQPHAEIESKARYRKGEGFTGRAWEEPNTWLFQPLDGYPLDADREEFEKYYTRRLKIREDVVRKLSSYMERVHCIHSYGFADREGFLAVLSVDIQGNACAVTISPEAAKFGFEQLREVMREVFREKRRLHERQTTEG